MPSTVSQPGDELPRPVECGRVTASLSGRIASGQGNCDFSVAVVTARD